MNPTLDKHASCLYVSICDMDTTTEDRMYRVESHNPYAGNPHLLDEHHECTTIEEAGLHFADLTGWDETDAINALVEDDLIHIDEETGREVTAVRVPVNAGASR